MAWQWNKRLRRYQESSTGKILSSEQQRALHQQFIDKQKALTDDIARRLAAREITLQQAEALFRERIKTVWLDEYALGIGGRYQMTPTDFGRVGAMVKTQYNYAHIFFQEIARGEHSEAMVRLKMGRYLESGGMAYERANALSHGFELPTYPRDGTQECRANCRCYWSIEETEGEWRARWVKARGDNCATCIDNASSYNPLVLKKAA